MSERDWKDRLHDSGYFPWRYYREAGNGTVEAMIYLLGVPVIVFVLASHFYSDFPYWFEQWWSFVALGFGWLASTRLNGSGTVTGMKPLTGTSRSMWTSSLTIVATHNASCTKSDRRMLTC